MEKAPTETRPEIDAAPATPRLKASLPAATRIDWELVALAPAAMKADVWPDTRAAAPDSSGAMPKLPEAPLACSAMSSRVVAVTAMPWMAVVFRVATPLLRPGTGRWGGHP